MKPTGNLAKDLKDMGREFVLNIWKGMSPNIPQLRSSDGKKGKRKKKKV